MLLRSTGAILEGDLGLIKVKWRHQPGGRGGVDNRCGFLLDAQQEARIKRAARERSGPDERSCKKRATSRLLEKGGSVDRWERKKSIRSASGKAEKKVEISTAWDCNCKHGTQKKEDSEEIGRTRVEVETDDGGKGGKDRKNTWLRFRKNTPNFGDARAGLVQIKEKGEGSM